MQNDPKNIPMTRIQERAPKEKWMRDARAKPGPVGQHGVIDATMLDPNTVNPPRPEGLPERGVGRPTPPDATEIAMQKQVEAAQAEAASAQQEVRDRKAESEALQDKLQQLRNDLKQSNANVEQLKARVVELEGDRREDADELGTKLAHTQEQLDAANSRIAELEAREPEVKEVEVEVETEVYPARIVMKEVTNVRHKGKALIIKGMVDMGEGEEDHQILVRMSFDEVAEVIGGA